MSGYNDASKIWVDEVYYIQRTGSHRWTLYKLAVDHDPTQGLYDRVVCDRPSKREVLAEAQRLIAAESTR